MLAISLFIKTPYISTWVIKLIYIYQKNIEVENKFSSHRLRLDFILYIYIKVSTIYAYFMLMIINMPTFL